ncbi:MAG: alkaline phosphatase [Gammaproteobacteria bacterium]|nr:MAG: alkaline phosphatase [Gammaproteobacteria bacterium]
MAKLTVSRRRVLQTMGVAASGLVAPFAVAGNGSRFRHGVASGDPLADRVILWTRITPKAGASGPAEVSWEVSEDLAFKRIVTRGTEVTDADRDYTVKVDASGLEAGETYFYRFSAGDDTSPVGRTRTLPKDGVRALKLAVVSCSNYPQGYFNVYHEIAARDDIHAVLHLGDYIYEYAAGGYANPHAVNFGHHVEPEHEIVTLDDYRARHAVYKTEPGLQAVHAAHPMIAVWDDHESANDSWRHGAENHDETQGSWYDRKRASVQAYREWLPIRDAEDGDPLRIYRHFDFGGLADLIMLDARLIGRSEPLLYAEHLGDPATDAERFRNALHDPQRTILGNAQLDWLNGRLQSAQTPWQILGQQVLMGKVHLPDVLDVARFPAEGPFTRPAAERLLSIAEQGLPFNLDAWDGYPAARERVFAAGRTHGSNLISLAGDTHNGWAFNLADERGRPAGVEFATPSVSSPGMEIVAVPPGILAERFVAANPELVYLDSARRGWLEVAITPESATGRWHFVTTVLSRTYQPLLGPAWRVHAGEATLQRA